MIKEKGEDVGQMMLDIQGKLKGNKIDQAMHHELLCELIIRHNLPYKFVEYPELRNWISYLCPNAIMVTRKMILGDCTLKKI